MGISKGPVIIYGGGALYLGLGSLFFEIHFREGHFEKKFNWGGGCISIYHQSQSYRDLGHSTPRILICHWLQHKK